MVQVGPRRFWANLGIPSGLPRPRAQQYRIVVHDAARDRAEGPAPGGPGHPPALPYAKAFVVQFAAETDADLNHAAGRIEHLQTGQRSRFASLDEMLARMRAILTSTDSLPDDG
jgi:hypothetical protein